MRILFVTPYLATPPRYGAQRRLDGLMRGLARSHEISLVTFVDPEEDVACAIRATEAYCAKIVAVPNQSHSFTTEQKRLLQLRSMFSRRSYESFVYHGAALTRALERLLADGSYDVVNFEFAQMAGNGRLDIWPARRRSLFILDEHNIEYDILRRTAANARGVDRKVYSALNWRKLRSEERAAWRRFDGCAVTSTRDERLLRRDLPSLPTAVVPNAVDVGFFRPSGRCARPDPLTLLFFGAVSYHPNTDGLLFFLREILPRVKARYPDVRLRIVGPSVPAEIAARAGDGVEVVGLVDDIRPYLESATVIVVPLRIGGGTRFKILEAMAMGKPIVSTTIGAEGLDVRDGSEILLADKPDAFALQVGRLLDDAPLRDAMGAAGRALVERRYSWDASVARLEEFYGELMARRERS